MPFSQGRMAETPGANTSGGLAFDEEMCRGEEAVQVSTSVYRLRVQTDALFAKVQVLEEGAPLKAFHVREKGRHGTRDIAIGRLHLDDTRAHIGEDTPADRHGDEFTPLDDDDATKKSRIPSQRRSFH
jgi:hypothetical protein